MSARAEPSAQTRRLIESAAWDLRRAATRIRRLTEGDIYHPDGWRQELIETFADLLERTLRDWDGAEYDRFLTEVLRATAHDHGLLP